MVRVLARVRSRMLFAGQNALAHLNEPVRGKAGVRLLLPHVAASRQGVWHLAALGVRMRDRNQRPSADPLLGMPWPKAGLLRHALSLSLSNWLSLYLALSLLSLSRSRSRSLSFTLSMRSCLERTSGVLCLASSSMGNNAYMTVPPPSVVAIVSGSAAPLRNPNPPDLPKPGTHMPHCQLQVAGGSEYAVTCRQGGSAMTGGA